MILLPQRNALQIEWRILVCAKIFEILHSSDIVITKLVRDFVCGIIALFENTFCPKFINYE